MVGRSSVAGCGRSAVAAFEAEVAAIRERRGARSRPPFVTPSSRSRNWESPPIRPVLPLRRTARSSADGSYGSGQMQTQATPPCCSITLSFALALAVALTASAQAQPVPRELGIDGRDAARLEALGAPVQNDSGR